MTPLVQAEHLGRSFGGGLWRRPVQAVADVSLAVARGEAVGLVGESGSGKSTIGRMMLGLLRPSTGRVLLEGRDIARFLSPAERRRMQLVFQDPFSSLDPRRRVGAQIGDGLAIHRMASGVERRARVAALLGDVGLDPAHASRFPHEFSGGQRQRIAIARALAPQPDFLVADEAVSALDVSVQAQILALIAGLRTRLGIGLLFISHDLEVVRALCDRVVVLYGGRVMEEGPVAPVFSNPAHPYTRALLSAAPSLDPARRRTRIPLAGDPTNLPGVASGCVFQPRCPIAAAECAQSRPAPAEVQPRHTSSCFRLAEVPRLLPA